MSTELTMLAYVAGLTVVLWIPYILANIVKAGPAAALTYRADTADLTGWAGRAKRAHYNAIENLAPFAALVLVAHAAGVENQATATSAVVYFWARVAHYLLHVAGVPLARTLAFTVGWLAMLCIFWQIVSPA